MLSPKLEELIAFQLVAESGSYATAARIVGKDPSVVSRRIAGLEKTLGAKLLERTSRSVILTPTGARYLERITVILADLAEANREAAAQARD